ncbi:MAG: hypothetical protein LBC08_03905 [Campylobacteraceae bacterium]|nr:hypothetical protein [Campylobacteraceae bacterium]
MAGLTTKTTALSSWKFKALFLSLLLSLFLIGCGGGGSDDAGTHSGSGGGACGDISYEAVKNTANFPPYDLPANSFPREQLFTYYPLSDINAYAALLKSKGFILSPSIETVILYAHYSSYLIPDVAVTMFKMSDGSYSADIFYRANPNLASAVIPTGVPLVQYQLVEHHVGERVLVINHLTKYKNDLKKMGFEEIEGGSYGRMEKEVGNCVYSWFYQHTDHYLKPNDGYINYNWIIVDKAFGNLEVAQEN